MNIIQKTINYNTIDKVYTGLDTWIEIVASTTINHRRFVCEEAGKKEEKKLIVLSYPIKKNRVLRFLCWHSHDNKARWDFKKIKIWYINQSMRGKGLSTPQDDEWSSVHGTFNRHVHGDC